jgi:hypothetical protein
MPAPLSAALPANTWHSNFEETIWRRDPRKPLNPTAVMLRLNDPLWKKLDDAHRDRDIPGVLSELARSWNEEAADQLFWDCLCHQGTCYGATYAAIPHLIKIAQPTGNIEQRLGIAVFLGYVVLRARLQHNNEEPPEDQPLAGLPDYADQWDRKLDVFRELLSSLEDPDMSDDLSHYKRTILLPRYRQIVKTGAVNAQDMDKIATIRADFWSALPRIGAICERAYLENKSTVALLGGVAAATGQIDVAELLYSGKEGALSCENCGAAYHYRLHDGRVAIYADEPPASPLNNKALDRLMLDHHAGTTSRADGFVTPVRDDDTFTLLLAKRAETALPELLIRSFLGHIHCCRCGETAAIMTRRFEE